MSKKLMSAVYFCYGWRDFVIVRPVIEAASGRAYFGDNFLAKKFDETEKYTIFAAQFMNIIKHEERWGTCKKRYRLIVV